MQPPAILLNGITQETRVTTAVAIASHGPGSETGSPAPVNGRPRSRRLGAWYVALRPGTSFWTAVSCFHHVPRSEGAPLDGRSGQPPTGGFLSPLAAPWEARLCPL